MTTNTAKPVASTMRHPSVDAAGDLYEAYVPDKAPDPFMDDCPAWCQSRDAGHIATMFEDDRRHEGIDYRLPVRSIPLTLDSDGPEDENGCLSSYILGHQSHQIVRESLRSEPQMWVGVNDSSNGVLYTLDEAEVHARLVLRLVEEARRVAATTPRT